MLAEAHGGATSGNYVGKATARKMLRVGFWWPTLHKDVKDYCRACDVFQRTWKTLRRDEIPLEPQVTF